MQCLTRLEAQVWLQEYLGKDIEELKPFRTWRIPSDAGRKMSLSKHIFSSLVWDDGGVLLITGHGVWPSCENMLLFDGFRRNLGEERSVDEAPGHLIEINSAAEAEATFALGLYYMWDMLLVNARDKLVIHVDHHEEMSLATTHGESLTKVFELLQNFFN